MRRHARGADMVRVEAFDQPKACSGEKTPGPASGAGVSTGHLDTRHCTATAARAPTLCLVEKAGRRMRSPEIGTHSEARVQPPRHRVAPVIGPGETPASRNPELTRSCGHMPVMCKRGSATSTGDDEFSAALRPVASEGEPRCEPTSLNGVCRLRAWSPPLRSSHGFGKAGSIHPWRMGAPAVHSE
jgi:hypothetical protein